MTIAPHLAAMLQPIERKSLSDAVYEQLRDAIVSGQMAAGTRLPSERALCEQLGVNRGALREALQRLAQARLVRINHGGATRVLDYRAHSGLGLLPSLLVDGSGALQTHVARSVVEMRGALAPDIARLAALRGGPEAADDLDSILAEMGLAAGDDPALQRLALSFWDCLTDAADNVAYRLAFNTLKESYEGFMHLLTELMADEFRSLGVYADIASAVRSRDGAGAEAAARALMSVGSSRLVALLVAAEGDLS
jgi:GntR family transcriptional regulator, transcriptional repressor for pyruvate dehydrogenase complex